MADLQGLKVPKNYQVDVPFANQSGFYLKGSNSLEWGMKRHLANIFNPKSGNTVMFVVAVDIEDSIRKNADCMAVQTFVGADGQLSSLDNLNQVINAGMRYSIPTLGVCAVGKDMERTDRFFKLATRIIAEMGCQIVKTYNCENFEEVVAACPVPIVVAGGKKLAELEALTLAYDVMQKGARGVDMGRNIFQSEHPVEMAIAVNKVVHEGFTDKEAYEFYLDSIR